MKSKKVMIGLFTSLLLVGGITTIELKTESKTVKAATVSYKKSNTSELGELKTVNSRIYTAPGSSKSVVASLKYTHEIFYITKKATKTGGETYYQISRQSTVNAPVIGWVKSKEIKRSSYSIQKNVKKTYYIKGTGAGYTRPGGLPRNVLLPKMSTYKNASFTNSMTVKVGNKLWYRAAFNKNTVWLPATALVTKKSVTIAAPVEKKVSRVAKLKSSTVKIQSDLKNSKTVKVVGNEFKNTLTITKSANYNKVNYYNLMKGSQQLGWVKQSDVTSYAYKTPTSFKATYYLLGNGYGYTHPWGASGNIVTKDLKGLKNSAFKITKVATVGKSLWYYGTTTKNQKLWIAANRMTSKKVTEVSKPVEQKPVKPVEPKPVEPVKPVEPKPVEPVKPTEPKPVEPVKPAEPKPVEPVKPAEPEKPVVAPIYSAQSKQGILKANATIYTDFSKLTKKTVTTNEKTENFTINRSVKANNATYYELTRMTTAAKSKFVGWVKSTEVTLTSVTQPTASTAVFYLSGEGNATNIAGGTATANLTFKDLKSYPAAKFTAIKSQKIKDTTYYLGKINSKYAWVSEANFGQPYRYFNLRKTANIELKDMQKYLVFKKGEPIKSTTLYKTLPSFLAMEKKYGINAQFMLAHAILETGWGRSEISKYKNNFFGYQAYDTCAMTCALYFKSGKDGIEYYADTIYRNYLRAGGIYNNGVSAAGMNVRYASDKSWAQHIARLMEEMKPYDSAYYDKQPISTLNPAQPNFTKTNVIPVGKSKPPTYRDFPTGITAEVMVTTPARLLPYKYGLINSYHSVGKEKQSILISGTNDDVSNSWVRVMNGDKETWVSRSTIKIENLGQATMEANIRNKATTSGSKVLVTVPEKTFLKIILNTKGTAVTKKDASNRIWYEVQLPGKIETGWISSTIFNLYK